VAEGLMRCSESARKATGTSFLPGWNQGCADVLMAPGPDSKSDR
jgi:hypothetical protein